MHDEHDFAGHRRVVERYFGFLAVLVWSALSSAIELFPDDYVAEYTFLEPLFLFGSIPIAYLLYQIGVYVYAKGSDDKGNADVYIRA